MGAGGGSSLIGRKKAGAAWSGQTGDAEGQIGFLATTAIGVGGMVGGGIFAVLGLAVSLAGGGTPIAFLVAGAVALLTAYSYARLSVTFPSQGGTVVFLNRAFGGNYLTGSLNTLLWLSYIVMVSLYAYAFGGYGATFLPAGWQGFGQNMLISLAILIPMALNLLSAEIIGRAETWVVIVKVTLLVMFTGIGFFGIETDRLRPETWSSPVRLLAGGMIIFVAYEGFELIANTAQDVRDYRRVLPRAYFSAVIFVILLYVLVSMVTVGNLSLGQIARAEDYALAAAARPVLGTLGFRLIAVAALLSTFSAINATLYGSARLSFVIAKEGELPAFLEKKVWNRHIEGLLITTVLSLLLANLTDISSISTLGSVGFLLIFAAVNASNWVLWQQTRSRRWLCGLGFVACVAALGALLYQVVADHPARVWVVVALIGGAGLVEAAYRLANRKEIELSES
ncbi:MAG: APC family permease [Acidobacteriota bacterium]